MDAPRESRELADGGNLLGGTKTLHNERVMRLGVVGLGYGHLGCDGEFCPGLYARHWIRRTWTNGDKLVF